MLRCALLSISAVLFSVTDLLAEDPKAAEARPEKAPWQRRLQAADRKRVEELQKQFDALREAGKYANALTPAREIFTIRTRGQGADHWETIYAKWQVKTLERILATPVFDAVRLQGADWQQAQAERLLGQGKYAEAEALLRQAVVVGHDVLGEEYPLLADGYANLADILGGQGKYAEAELWDRQALAIRIRSLGEESPDAAESYTALGNALERQQKHAEAEALFQRALRIRQRIHGEDHADTAGAYNDLACYLANRRRYAEATPLFQKALDLRRRLLGKEHPGTALGYNNVGFSLFIDGKFAEAEDLFRTALQISRQALGEKHPNTVGYGKNLASTLYQQGKYVEAEKAWTDASDGFETARLSISFAGLERSMVSSEGAPYPDLAAVLARRGKTLEAWQRLEADLARGLLDDLSARWLRRLSPEERSREQDLLLRLQRLNGGLAVLLSAKGLTPGDRNKADALGRQREALQAELGRLEVDLAQKYGVAAGKIYTLAQVQHEVPADTALVAWLDIKAHAKATDPGGDHWACVIRKRGEPRWIRLAGSGAGGAWSAADDELPGQFRRVISSPPGTVPQSHQEIARRLFEQRLQPLRVHLGESAQLPPARHLVILSARSMAGIPLEALSDQFTISYAPSGTVFAWLQEERKKPRTDRDSLGPRLLALGDPVYESRALPVVKRGPAPLLRSGRDQDYSRLPYTRTEVKMIARLFPGARLLLDSEASQQQLDDLAASGELRQYRYLHFATHGEVNSQLALQSALILSRDRLPDPVKQALAGKPVYDGRLTAEEILKRWQLDADLVTLSACQTGVGQQAGGEGYLGFSQALFLAGTRSLVVSLWKVDDRATALLMKRFYENLLGKRKDLKTRLPKAEALRQAKQWLRNLTVDDIARELQETDLEQQVVKRADGNAKHAERSTPRGQRVVQGPPRELATPGQPYAHPHYWAAFILLGDPN